MIGQVGESAETNLQAGGHAFESRVGVRARCCAPHQGQAMVITDLEWVPEAKALFGFFPVSLLLAAARLVQCLARACLTTPPPSGAHAVVRAFSAPWSMS